MHPPTLTLLTLLTPLTTALLPTKLIYESSPGTWYENIAVRPNGAILLTTITSPTLYTLSPLSPSPIATLLHTFRTHTWTTGITEATTPDTFYVSAANGSLITITATPKSHALYRVRFPCPSYNSNSTQPEVTLAALIPQASFLNGLTTLNATTILAADSHQGAVYAINVATGSSEILIQDPLMLPTSASPGLGINGIKIRHSFSGRKMLYFTNSALGIFAKLPLNEDGTKGGDIVVIARSGAGIFYDDFALDVRGDAFIATGSGNSVVGITKHPVVQSIIAGDINSTDIAEPTAAAFGRTVLDSQTLYVTTSGGLAIPVQTKDGPKRVGAQVVAVDTSGLYCEDNEC